MKTLVRDSTAGLIDLSPSCWAIDRAMFEVMRTDAPLSAVLSVLCRSVEQQAPGLLCSILILDETGTGLRHGAAPSLPESYNRAAEWVPVGPSSGSCGTAVYRRAPVMCNIADDPLWENFRELALSHGLRACWSSPVTSREHKILGTFGIYYREARRPSSREEQLVKWATQLAGIAIERKQIEDAMLKQREELETIFDAAPVMIWYKDCHNRIIRANRPAAESLGLLKRELEGREVSDLFPEDAAAYHQDDLEVIRTGRPKLNIQEVMRTPAGEMRRVMTDKLPYRDLDGKIVGVIAFVRDMTDQHRTETALRVAEKRFRTLVEQLPTITYVAVHDEPGRWEYVSPQIEGLLGFSPGEWLARPGLWAERMHPEDRGRVIAEEQSSWQTGSTFVSEYRMLARDGRVLWFRDEAAVIRNRQGVPKLRQGVMLDITASRRMQADLRETQKRLSMTVNNAPVILFALDTQGTFQLSQGRALYSMGLKPGEVEGLSFFQLYRNNPPVLEHARRALAGEEFSAIAELPELKMWIETSWTSQRDAGGKLTGVIGVSHDITERKQTEMALQRSEASYRSMVERAPFGIYRVDRHGNLSSVNPALMEMLGYDSAEELMKVNLAADVYRDPAEHERLILENPDRIDQAEIGWKRKDGTPITVRLRGRAVCDASGAFLYFDSIAEEITERHELERQLRQAQRMEAVGRLVGGIAHDFNNLLLIIRGQLELLAESTQESRRQGLEEARKAADRAASLTRQLLAFGRMQVLQPRVVNLNLVIGEMQKLLPPLLGANIELTMKLDPDLSAVMADPGQMEQVILNLAVNARDAMPDGGRLTIATVNAEIDTDYARSRPPIQPGRYVTLTVHDSGKGMDNETQSHIFEPFFTTKAPGKGTGLGLATVYGIIKQSRGYIWVTSERDKGSTFQICLPQVEDLTEKAKHAEPQESAPVGTETVLVTEDQDGVRDVTCEFLRKCGYRILEAQSGHEAIAIAESSPEPIHVLVTDMVMPGLSGRELARRMAELRPGIKVVCMSGYSEHVDQTPEAGFFDALRLQKPFTREELARIVREAIDGPSARG